MSYAEWKIYYAGGLTYSNLNGPPELAPKTKVLGIVVFDEEIGWRLERSEDYYILVPEFGGWRGANPARYYEYMFEPGVKIVLFGCTVSDSEFRSFLNQAVSDPDFPNKSAYRRGETRI